jgi:HlyD family secretion protein
MAGGNGNGARASRKRRIVVVAALAAVLAVGSFAALRRSGKELDPSKVASVERGDLARSVVATGKVQPLSKVDVKSKASGIVKKLYVHYGDRVATGQLLAELDKELLEASVSEARANLLAAEAAYERNKIEAEGPDLPFLKSAQERARKLHTEGLISPSVLDDAEKATRWDATADTAKNTRRCRRPRSRGRPCSTAPSDPNATCEAPGRAVSPATWRWETHSRSGCGPRPTLSDPGDVSDVYVLGKVDEADIGKVYLGQAARIVVESFKDKKYEGKVTKISPLGKEKDNVTTFEVRVSIKNPTGELKVNMSANAEIISREAERAPGPERDCHDRTEYNGRSGPASETGRAVPGQVGDFDGERLSGPPALSRDQLILQ